MILKIKEYREFEQMTQKELALKINNVQRNVSNWENGTSEPDCDTIVKIANIFNISIDELFGVNYKLSTNEQFTKLDYEILKYVHSLTPKQKDALIIFLKELNI